MVFVPDSNARYDVTTVDRAAATYHRGVERRWGLDFTIKQARRAGSRLKRFATS